MKNKLGDKCCADSMKIIRDKYQHKTYLLAEVDGFMFDSGEYENNQAWLQAIVERVYNCAMGKLNS